MTEGVVAEWHKSVGDSIESGDLLADIETDKATMEFESFQEGVFLHIGVEKGQTAPVDSILAILGEKGEDVTALLQEDQESQESSKDVVVETESNQPKVEEVKPVEVSPPTPQPAPSIPSPQTPTTTSFPPSTTISNGVVKASPLAKKLADERGLNLNLIKGTGTDGRIVKRDIENFQGKSSFSGVESFVDAPVSQM